MTSKYSRPSRAALLLSVAALPLSLGCSSAPPDAVDSSFDFTTHAFTFTNFDSSHGGGDMTAPLAARMFGDDAVCTKGAGDTCEPNAAAKTWVEEVNATLLHGHSEGMAVLSLLMAMGKVDPNAFGGPDAASLSFDNRALRGEIAYWAATQKILSTHARDKKLAPDAVIPFLAKALTDKNEGWRLLIAMRDESGFRAGHAVVPFGYFKGSNANQYFIRIYDSNFPGEERRIELDTKANTWVYEGSPNPDAPRTYTGNADNPLSFSPVSDRLGVLVPPFTDGFAASAQEGAILVGGDGVEVGFKEGRLVETGGSLVPGAADCFCKAPIGVTNVLITGNGPKTVTVGADAGTVYATSSTVSAKVEGSNGAGGITIDPTQKTVTYNTTSDAGTAITTTTKNADGSQTTVTVVVDKPSTSVTVDASDPSKVKVSADVGTTTTTVSVTTTVTQPDGTSKSTTTTGTTKGGNDADVTVNTMTGETSVNTNVNYATCLNGKKDPMEADIDCGDFCTMQTERRGDGHCATGSPCSKNNDCETPLGSQAGECFSNKCSEQTCSDGRKNLFETSVDCGGGCPCGAGFACTSQSGCRDNTECFNMVCTKPQELSLSVVGLGSDSFVRVFYSRDGTPETFADLYGQAGAATFTRTFKGITSFSARVSADSHSICTFDSASTQGRWEWSASTAATPPPNTLRCRRVKTDIAYSTANSGCPLEIERTAPNAFVRAWEVLPSGPLLSIAASHPAVALSGASSTLVQKSAGPVVWSSLTVGADGGFYDGGTAYTLSLGGAVTANSTYRYNTTNAGQIASLGLPLRTYRYSCSLGSPASGGIVDGTVTASLSCVCDELTDAGTMTVDSGVVDGGTDAGSSDAGAGACTTDSQCVAGADCYCANTPGNCPNNTGRCGAAKAVFKVPTTDGIAPSGTFTVPAGCNQVAVEAWGAAGGVGQMVMMGPPLVNSGGAGGYVGGVLNVTPTEVFTVWVGQAGDLALNNTPNQGQGSYLGTPAAGGRGDGVFNQSGGGSGGGLTSVKHAQGNGTVINTFSVPGGGGAGGIQPAENAGGPGTGNHSTRSGQNATVSSQAGGGGAGDNGGTAGTSGGPGIGGGFGTLPSGFTSGVGATQGTPANNTAPDIDLLCNGAGRSFMSSASGCVVLRCVP